MNRQDFQFLHHLRVRWVEVDLQKIVFNGHYLMYLDTAMAAYWRALALPYQDSMQQLGGDLYVVKSSLEYKASAEYDDVLHVGLRCARVGNASILFEACVFRGQTLLVKGELVYVYADPQTKTSMPVPQVLRDTMLGFEQGQAMTTLALGNWTSLKADSSPLRNQVFVQEQGVSQALEWDEQDAQALHAVLRNRLGMTIATGRLLPSVQGEAKIGRMAVLRPMRGMRFGEQVLQGLMDAARARGDSSVWLHAQCSAEPFYHRQGFVRHGEVFEEAGIAHIEMRMSL
ncbi:MAG: YbgC/FadM family acyl-CoA thioesterase [Betaproteobacteria bacterium]|nr:YbgC/FadM family acyl-CoA thioesterase [Betaproteobacteria bacterium]